MILNREEILNLCLEKSERVKNPLIQPLKEKNLKISSYDLTIGNEFYCRNDNETSWNESLSIETQKLKKEQTFYIPPHGICYILCSEKISLPDDLSAKISLRMKHIYSGLIITSQPPFDPGYTGNVIILIYNLSSEACYLKEGERIATIEFFQTSPLSDLKEPHKSVTSLSRSLNSPVRSSLLSIDKTAKESKSRANRVMALMLTFGTAISALLGFQVYSSQENSQKIIDMSEKVSRNRIHYEDQKNDIRLSLEKIVNLKNYASQKEKEIIKLEERIEIIEKALKTQSITNSEGIKNGKNG